jgi:hypothetical protein
LAGRAASIDVLVTRALAPALVLVLAPACLVDNPRWDGADAGDDTGANGTGGDDTGGTPSHPGCDREPAPEVVVEIGPADAARLDEIAASAVPGTALVLADGTYDRAGEPAIDLAAPGVQLRSASGDPASVVIDGGGSAAELVIVRGEDVLIAELTLKGAENLVRVNPSPAAPVARPRLHRVHMLDPSNFALAIEAEFEGDAYADDGTVSCSVFSLSDERRASLPTCESVAAIKAFGAAGWVVRDNLFEDFWCPSSPAFVAVNFTAGSRDTIVERNEFRDAYRALMLGFQADPAESTRPAPAGDCPATAMHFGGRIVNNMLWVGGPDLAAASAGVDSMISVWSACDVEVQHNTAVNLLPVFSAIEHRFSDTTGTIANNLLTGAVLARDPAAVVVAGNVENVGLEAFVDPAAGDLHLLPAAATAIDAGVVVGAGPPADDFDTDPRDAAPDVGADEWVPSG